MKRFVHLSSEAGTKATEHSQIITFSVPTFINIKFIYSYSRRIASEHFICNHVLTHKSFAVTCAIFSPSKKGRATREI